MTDREHAQQRALVQLRERLGISRSERRDEAAVQARLYCRPRERVDNIVPMRSAQDEQDRRYEHEAADDRPVWPPTVQPGKPLQ